MFVNTRTPVVDQVMYGKTNTVDRKKINIKEFKNKRKQTNCSGRIEEDKMWEFDYIKTFSS